MRNRRFAERMRQGVGFGRQVVPVGRLWGRIPTGPQNRAVGLIAAGYSSNRGPVVTIMHSPGHCRRFNARARRAFITRDASAKSRLFRENLNTGIRGLNEVHDGLSFSESTSLFVCEIFLIYTVKVVMSNCIQFELFLNYFYIAYSICR